MKNKSKKAKFPIMIPLLLVIAVIMFKLAYPMFDESNKADLSTAENMIITEVQSKYPAYSIDNIRLEYVDWSSSVREADKDHRATEATVVMSNKDESRTIHLENHFAGWKITHDEPNFGANVPDGEYYLEYNYNSVGSAVDMESYVKEH